MVYWLKFVFNDILPPLGHKINQSNQILSICYFLIQKAYKRLSQTKQIK